MKVLLVKDIIMKIDERPSNVIQKDLSGKPIKFKQSKCTCQVLLEDKNGEEYSTMSLDKIKSCLIDNNINTKENSILFLWVTFPMLKEGLEVMNAWGFKYKTCGFNWIKLNKNGKPFFGIGSYTKSNSELCLLGIKGKGLPILDNTISQIVMTEKDKHSKKPSEVRDKIVQLYGDRKRIELFARNKTPGWDTWGNEV